MWALAWLWAGCARESAPTVSAPGAWRDTDAGLYRVSTAVSPDGRVTNWVVDRQGRPVVDAWVRVEVPGRAVLDDPGECDAVGEARCSHPAGRYEARIAAARGCSDAPRTGCWRHPNTGGPGDDFAAGFRVVVDGSDGADALDLRHLR